MIFDKPDNYNHYYVIATSDVNLLQYQYKFSLDIAGGGHRIDILDQKGNVVNRLPQGFENSNPCFLPGTEIAVADGTRKVEDIRVGDRVIVHHNGQRTERTVTWVGKAPCQFDPSRPYDESEYPIRILKNAIAENVPYKDLLITAEHSFFFDGQFIPARMLVNDASIFYDTSITSYEYYHIETDEHTVIIADGMLTESYLDTGNRHLFPQEGKVVTFDPTTTKSWDNDAAAPLVVTREVVEPLYRQFQARAEAQQIPTRIAPPELTDATHLRLITNTGESFTPSRITKENYAVFTFPSLPEFVHILSNTSRPCDTVGPFLDDRRSLGILIGEILLYTRYGEEALTSYLDDETLPGWHNREPAPMRWTNGHAFLPLTRHVDSPRAVLALQIVAAGPYAVHDIKNKNVTTKLYA